MKTYYRIAKEAVVHPNGQELLLKKGEKTLTSDVLDGSEVMVLSRYWYRMPLSAFEESAEPAYGHHLNPELLVQREPNDARINLAES